MVEKHILGSRSEWLESRKTIGGSESSALIGLNPYMSNIDLWEIKTGKKTSEVMDNDLMAYGREAEKHLRELFKLDYPEYRVEYAENNIFTNPNFPFAHASLDGWLYDRDNRMGIWECKTALMTNSAQKAKWDNRIPDNYYCQLCWYMGVCEADFAVLKAQLKWKRDDGIFEVTKHYKVERAEVQADIDLLMDKGREFWNCVVNDRRPPLILSKI